MPFHTNLPFEIPVKTHLMCIKPTLFFPSQEPKVAHSQDRHIHSFHEFLEAQQVPHPSYNSGPAILAAYSKEGEWQNQASGGALSGRKVLSTCAPSVRENERTGL